MKKSSIFRIFGLLMFCMAVMFGADPSIAMAVAVTGEGTDTYQTGSNANNASPGAHGEHTGLDGTAATYTQVESDADLNKVEIDQFVVKFKPGKFALYTDLMANSRTVNVDDYEVKHFVSNVSELNYTMLKAFTTSNSATSATFYATSGNEISEDCLRQMGRSTLVVFKGVPGYVQDGIGSTEYGELTCRVAKRDTTSVTIVPINGKWNSTANDYVIPTIPVGTQILISVTALHETQMEVSPDNSKPVPKEVYLQKKGYNTVFSDEFDKKTKEIDWGKKDIMDNALYNYKRRNERNLLIGVKSKTYVKDEDLGDQLVYTSEGLLWQLQDKFAISRGQITQNELVQICEKLFVENSFNETMDVYCGSGFMTTLLNQEFIKVANSMDLAKQDKFGVHFTEFSCPFGTLNFKMCYSLNDIGMSNCAFAVDTKMVTRYVKRAGSTQTDDMKKSGSGESKEATRNMYIEADGFSYMGCNSMIIGPSDELYSFDSLKANSNKLHTFTYAQGVTNGLNLEPDASKSTSVFYGQAATVIPLPVDGDVWYLEALDTFSRIPAGKLIKWDSSQWKWVLYNGIITA